MERLGKDTTCPEISITETEKRVFSYVLEYCDTLDVLVTPRVVGGWVRDKLVGRESHDLDIALDKMSGYRFALGMAQFYGTKISAIGLVRPNPEKSKHLETAVVKIEGRFVDFVCLRTEKYVHTRIPDVVIGTATEDAFRRDITVNALFYNLRTGKIEDHTRLGMHDLRSRVIRTPIDPLQTFMDDPLRILRVFRFSGRLGFQICSEIYDSLRNENLGGFLCKKVSNERVGSEIMKIIELKDGARVLVDMIKHGLYKHVFKPAESIEVNHEAALLFMQTLNAAKSNLVYGGACDLSICNLYTVLIFSSCLALRKKASIPLNTAIVKDSLKFPNSFAKRISEIENNLYYISTDRLFQNSVLESSALVRMARKLGSECTVSLLLAYTYGLVCKSASDSAAVKHVYTQIVACGYADAYSVRPIVTGHDVKSCFQVEGSVIKHIIDEGVVYQVLNPEAEKGEIIKHLSKIFQKILLCKKNSIR
eukprot:jgi/Antlo1/1374/1217